MPRKDEKTRQAAPQPARAREGSVVTETNMYSFWNKTALALALALEPEANTRRNARRRLTDCFGGCKVYRMGFTAECNRFAAAADAHLQSPAMFTVVRMVRKGCNNRGTRTKRTPVYNIQFTFILLERPLASSVEVNTSINRSMSTCVNI